MHCSKPPFCTAYFIALLIAGQAGADTVWIGLGANPIQASGVKIVAIDGEQLIFTSQQGAQTTKLLSQISQIAVDDEPAFSAAEVAYRAEKWPGAVDGYLASLHDSAKDWVKTRSAVRLATAADRAHRFDAAVIAYIFLIQQNSTLAERSQPRLADANADALAVASTELGRSLEPTTLSDPQRVALLRLGLAVGQAKNDSTQISGTLQQLAKLNALSPAEQATLSIFTAQAALAAKDFRAAVSAIQEHRAQFTEPVQQIEALFTLAQAQDGLCNRSDAQALKDVGIGYMRVVTFGKDVQGQPHVSDSLLHLGQIEEELKEPRTAADLYQQIARDYASEPAAAAAKANLERINKGA